MREVRCAACGRLVDAPTNDDPPEAVLDVTAARFLTEAGSVWYCAGRPSCWRAARELVEVEAKLRGE